MSSSSINSVPHQNWHLDKIIHKKYCTISHEIQYLCAIKELSHPLWLEKDSYQTCLKSVRIYESTSSKTTFFSKLISKHTNSQEVDAHLYVQSHVKQEKIEKEEENDNQIDASKTVLNYLTSELNEQINDINNNSSLLTLNEKLEIKDEKEETDVQLTNELYCQSDKRRKKDDRHERKNTDESETIKKNRHYYQPYQEGEIHIRTEQRKKRKGVIEDEIVNEEEQKSVGIISYKKTHWNKNMREMITILTDEEDGLNVSNQNQQRQETTKRISKNIGKFNYRLQDCQNNKVYGSFLRDAPDHICNHKLNYDSIKNQQNLTQLTSFNVKLFLYKIRWKKRPSQRIPKPSYFTYFELKKVTPRLLLDYIEQIGMLNK